MTDGIAAPSAPTSAPTGASGGSASPQPTGPGQSSGGPGIAPAEARQSPPQGTPPAPVQPKRDPWLRKVRIGEGETAQEHELDLSEHLPEYKRKVKVLGEEQEVSLEDAFRDYPLAVGAQRKFEDAAKLRKEATADRELVEKQRTAIREGLANPKSARTLLAKAMGSDAKVLEWMENELHEHYEYQKLTPQQRQARDQERTREDGMTTREREIHQREQRLKAEDERRHKETVSARVAELQKSVPAALEAVGIPSTPYSIDLFTRAKLAARAQGVDMTDAQAAASVKREVEQLTRSFAKDPKALREAIGDEGAEGLRKAELERLDQQPGRRAQRVEGQQQARQAQQQPQKRQTLEEFKEERRREHEEKQQAWLNGRR